MKRIGALAAVAVLLLQGTAGRSDEPQSSFRDKVECHLHSWFDAGQHQVGQACHCCREHLAGPSHHFLAWLTNRPLPASRPTLCPACCKRCAPCCYPPLYTFFLYPGCCPTGCGGVSSPVTINGSAAGTLAPGCACGH